MTPEELACRVRAGTPVTFNEVMAVINEHFVYRPCRFTNGLGDDPIVNNAGTNEGSCKIFYFGRLLGLDREETLALFGDFYHQDVLNAPDGTNHANIRRFMRDGWAGVVHEDIALEPRASA
jgi:hypothetical protein